MKLAARSSFSCLTQCQTRYHATVTPRQKTSREIKMSVVSKQGVATGAGHFYFPMPDRYRSRTQVLLDIEIKRRSLITPRRFESQRTDQSSSFAA
jgi:hypothetical protein